MTLDRMTRTTHMTHQRTSAIGTGAIGTGDMVWRKSSYSGPQGGNCVEVATTGAHILLRDSKHPHDTPLACTGGAWTAFLAGVTSGEFDQLA